jgi:hypothetical protein
VCLVERSAALESGQPRSRAASRGQEERWPSKSREV